MTPSASWCHTPPGRVTPLRTGHRAKAHARRHNASIGVKDARRPKRRPVASKESTRSGGVNPIGKNQPDQKGLISPDQVHTSPHTSIHASDGQQAACDAETHRQGRATDRPHRSPPHRGGQRRLWAMLQCPLESARSWPLTANRRRRWEGTGGVGEPGRASRHGGARIEVARVRGPRSLLARNTGGATSNTRPHMRAPRPADAGRGVLTRRGAKV